MNQDITVAELIATRNTMGARIIASINEQIKQFTASTGVAVVDIQLSVTDEHVVERVYILLDI